MRKLNMDELGRKTVEEFKLAAKTPVTTDEFSAIAKS